MADGPKLTTRDAALVNLATVIAMPVVRDRDVDAMAWDGITSLLPKCTREHHFIGHIAVCLEKLDRGSHPENSNAMAELRGTLLQFFNWRAGLALEALQSQAG